MRYALLAAALLLALAVAAAFTGDDWRTASREPVGLAPSAGETPAAVIQVYAARAVRWRGYFGVHTWIAAKAPNAPAYTVFEVNGWRLRRNGTAVVASARAPDGRWFGNAPMLLADVRGPAAEALLQRLEQAVGDYPYADTYRVWPGPNSNTFTAHVLRALPELQVDLPPTAIGKDYLGAQIGAAAPSGTGYQVNLLGTIGLLVAVREGIELNLLGLTFGIDPLDLALKLPLIGRVDGPPLLLAAALVFVFALIRRRRLASR